MKWLISHGIRPRFDDTDLAPLHCAASKGHVEVTRLLLQHNADSEPQTIEGSTPLHEASDSDHPNVA
jgi:ankyrin repeat protein